MIETPGTASSETWNLASVWETIADELADVAVLIHGEHTITWREFDERSARLASVFADHGIGHDSKVALYLYNGPAYLETTFAAFKVRAVPVNVNYRYTESELGYLLDNADAEAIVVHAVLAPNLLGLLSKLPKLRLVLVVGGTTDIEVIDAIGDDYDETIAAAAPAPRIRRSPDDLWFLYTGGTTGMPKGVMWPHRSLFAAAAPTFTTARVAAPTSLQEVGLVARQIHAWDSGTRLLPAAPLMHGTSAISTLSVLCAAGSIVLLTSRQLDADELLTAVQRHRVTNLTIVGDAFARPILAALERAEQAGRPYDVSSLDVVVSSGVMWSESVKAALLERVDVALADLLGSSEGVGFARSVARRDRSVPTARFRLGEHAQVFTDDDRAVEPGSGESGHLAVGGPIPVGYYKDPEQTAATFRTIAGRVWSMPGDIATVEADGTISLMGRGSACINTAGEKVFVEEVEETLKTHPAVRDANVIGVPDERWGNAVCAVVSIDRGLDSAATAGSAAGAAAEQVLIEGLLAHCRNTLAGYKCPKRIVTVETIRRGPNGKADYRWARDVVDASLAEPSPEVTR